MPRQRASSPQARALIAALLEQPRTWRYGYDLSKQTGLPSGTLYPLLMRLADRKLLDEDWREPEYAGRPARHAYRLTSDGIAFARELAREHPRAAPRPRLATGTT